MADETLTPAFALGGATAFAARIGPFVLAERAEGALFFCPATAGAPGDLRAGEHGLAWWAAPGVDFGAAPALPDGPGVVDQTDGWLWLDIAAPASVLAELCARLCDVDVPALAAPWSARTAIEHHGVWLVCPAPGAMVLLAPRSSARSLARAVTEAARSVVAQGLV